MLEVCAYALNRFGLELDVPEAGNTTYPNEPGAKVIVCSGNCQDEGAASNCGS